MSHTNPSETYRVESRRGLDEKMFFLIFHSVAKYENSGRPGARIRARRAHQFYVPRSNHYAFRTWLVSHLWPQLGRRSEKNLTTKHGVVGGGRESWSLWRGFETRHRYIYGLFGNYHGECELVVRWGMISDAQEPHEGVKKICGFFYLPRGVE